MKYIITESQYKLLLENSTFKKLKRKINKPYLSEFIEEAIEDFEQCSEFDDGYEYADEVITRAISNFLYGLTMELSFTHESFEEAAETLFEICWDWFADELVESFTNECSEEEDEEDFFSLKDLP
jgi:hypothetical protein